MMILLAFGIICLVLAIATVPLAARLPSRCSVWAVMAVVAVIGGIAGIFCSFNVRWQPSPTRVYLGFPCQAILWQLEDGQWVDYVGGPIGAVINVLWFASVSIFPVFFWVIFQ